MCCSIFALIVCPAIKLIMLASVNFSKVLTLFP